MQAADPAAALRGPNPPNRKPHRTDDPRTSWNGSDGAIRGIVQDVDSSSSASNSLGLETLTAASSCMKYLTVSFSCGITPPIPLKMIGQRFRTGRRAATRHHHIADLQEQVHLVAIAFYMAGKLWIAKSHDDRRAHESSWLRPQTNNTWYFSEYFLIVGSKAKWLLAPVPPVAKKMIFLSDFMTKAFRYESMLFVSVQSLLVKADQKVPPHENFLRIKLQTRNSEILCRFRPALDRDPHSVQPSCGYSRNRPKTPSSKARTFSSPSISRATWK